LQLERCTRDLAMFTLAIDSKPRGCDLGAGHGLALARLANHQPFNLSVPADTLSQTTE